MKYYDSMMSTNMSKKVLAMMANNLKRGHTQI